MLWYFLDNMASLRCAIPFKWVFLRVTSTVACYVMAVLIVLRRHVFAICRDAPNLNYDALIHYTTKSKSGAHFSSV